jgi:hypothetical protein
MIKGSVLLSPHSSSENAKEADEFLQNLTYTAKMSKIKKKLLSRKLS